MRGELGIETAQFDSNEDLEAFIQVSRKFLTIMRKSPERSSHESVLRQLLRWTAMLRSTRQLKQSNHSLK
jgi:hypothetical protein